MKLTWQGLYNAGCILTGTNVGGVGVNGIMALGADGGMFAFGNLGFLGAASLDGSPNPSGVTPTAFSAIAAKPSGGSPGYWDVTRNGRVVSVGVVGAA